jgi:hypothetical protein
VEYADDESHEEGSADHQNGDDQKEEKNGDENGKNKESSSSSSSEKKKKKNKKSKSKSSSSSSDKKKKNKKSNGRMALAKSFSKKIIPKGLKWNRSPVKTSSGEEGDEGLKKLADLSRKTENDIKKICATEDLKVGKKFEMIGRLLDKYQNLVSADELNRFTQAELSDMCKGRGIENEGNKEELISQLIKHVNETIKPISRKRPRTDDESDRPIKKRKIDCPITSSQFLNRAHQLNISIGKQPYSIDPKVYSTGSFGWHSTGKQEIEVDGKTVEVACNVNMTVLGYKPHIL